MKLRSRLFGLYVLFVGIYAVSLLLAPPSRIVLDQYNLTVNQLHLLEASIIIIMAAIWYIAFYGYSKLQAYSSLIKSTKDGKQVERIAKGILVLTIGVPFASVASSIMGIISRHVPDFIPASLIIRHYLDVLVPLIAFILISSGARGLHDLTKHRPPQAAINAIAGIFIVIGVAYCWIVLSVESLDKSYFLPEWLILASIVIPYMYIWYLGLMSAYEVHAYSLKVPGVVYRRNWNLFAAGIAAIILANIVYQYVTPLARQFSSLRLIPLLCITYALLALVSVGYILVALGAKKLQKIEEV